MCLGIWGRHQAEVLTGVKVQKKDRGNNAVCRELRRVTRDVSQLEFAFWGDHSGKLSGR